MNQHQNLAIRRTMTNSSSTLYASIHKIDFSIAQTTPQSPSFFLHSVNNKTHGASKKEVKMAHKKWIKNNKNAIQDSNHWPSGFLDGDLPATSLCFLHTRAGFWYVPIRTNRRLDIWTTKTKTEPVAGRREHGRSRPRQSRERRTRLGLSSKHHTESGTSTRAI